MSSKYIGGGIRICHWFINSFTTPWYFGNYPSSEVSLVTEGGNSTDWFWNAKQESCQQIGRMTGVSCIMDMFTIY